MTPEKTQALKDEFPALYKSLRCGEFECGDGWFHILMNLTKKLKRICPDPDFYLIVKEKFGTLRFQGGAWPEEVAQDAWDAIQEAEVQSETTCEWCGDKAVLRTHGGWLRTLCDPCEGNYPTKRINLEAD